MKILGIFVIALSLLLSGMFLNQIINKGTNSPYVETDAKVATNLTITEDADYPDTVLVFRHEGEVYLNKLRNEDNHITTK